MWQTAVHAVLVKQHSRAKLSNSRGGKELPVCFFWWKAARPFSGSDRRKRTFVQAVGQGPAQPLMVITACLLSHASKLKTGPLFISELACIDITKVYQLFAIAG